MTAGRGWVAGVDLHSLVVSAALTEAGPVCAEQPAER